MWPLLRRPTHLIHMQHLFLEGVLMEVRMSGSVWISRSLAEGHLTKHDSLLIYNRWKHSVMFSERVEGLRTASYSRFWHRSYQLVDLEHNHSKLFMPQTTYYEISLAQDQRNLVKIESTMKSIALEPARHFLCRKVVSCACGWEDPMVCVSGTSHFCLLL